MNLKLYVGNDNLLKVVGLQNSNDGSFLNGITVQVVEILDADGNQVTGETWPQTLDYVVASDGDYRATLADTINLTAGESYTVVLVADGGTGLKGRWEFPVDAETRTVIA